MGMWVGSWNKQAADIELWERRAIGSCGATKLWDQWNGFDSLDEMLASN